MADSTVDGGNGAATLTSLARRATQALLDIAASREEAASATERDALKIACDHAESSLERLRLATLARSELEAGGVEVGAIKMPPGGVDVRRNLRATATAAVDPDTPLAKRLSGQPIHQAFKHAEGVVRVVKNALNDRVEAARLELLPPGIDAPVASMPGRESVATTLGRLRTKLTTRVSGVEPEQLPTTLAELRAAVDQWKSIRAELDDAMDLLDPAIKRFAEAATSPEGATWDLVTTEVLAWLNTDGNSDGYRVRKW